MAHPRRPRTKPTRRSLHLEQLENRRVLTAPEIIGGFADANSHEVPADTQPAALFDQPLDTATVSDQTVAIQGRQSGRLLTAGGNSFSASGNAITVEPARDFFPGELLEISTTAGVQNPGGEAAVAQVARFRIATTAGSGEFLNSGQTLGNQASFGVALGDLDGDGDLDAFVANLEEADAGVLPAPNRVYVNNNGTFTDSGQSLGNAASLQVELGDLDGDGDLDAFVANAGPNEIWLNDGNGAFTDSGLSLGSGLSLDVALGDLDADGDLDAVVANNTALVEGFTTTGEVWINNGDATSASVTTGPWAGGSGGIELGDLDDDGDLDVFVAGFTNAAGADVDPPQGEGVFLNNGDGTFTDSGQSLGSITALDVGLGDFDGDGDLDAAVSNQDNGGAGNRIYVNQGGGTFADSGQALHTGNDANRLAVGDLDGDGDLDLFVTSQPFSGTGPGSRVFVNLGGDQGGMEGTFADSGQSLGSAEPWSVALGDVNGDGSLDAFLANTSNDANTVWLNSLHPVSAYDAMGNVPIDVPVAQGLLAGTTGLQITTVDDAGLAGSVSVASDGSFTYAPAIGFRGLETFTAGQSDGETQLVAIEVGPAIWVVDQSASPGGDGSAAAPFQSLASLNNDGSDPDQPGDLIFLQGAHTYDVAQTGGFVLESNQDILTSWSDPFGQPQFMADIGFPLAPHSAGLPRGFTGRPLVVNSTADEPVVRVTADNVLHSFDIRPAGAGDAIVGENAAGMMLLHNIEVIPGPGSHSYDGVWMKNSDVELDFYNFVIGNFLDSTTSGTAFKIEGGEVDLFAHDVTRTFQIGGGLLSVSGTTGDSSFVFDPSTNLGISHGSFGFDLQDNAGAAFDFGGEFFLIGMAAGITAVNSGTIEMPAGTPTKQRDVDAHSGPALNLSNISIGAAGWHLDEVNGSGGANAIRIDNVSGAGMTINETDAISTSSTAVHVTNSPGVAFDFGETLVFGDAAIIETIAGTGTSGSAGDGDLATAAQLASPAETVTDIKGNLYIVDSQSHTVRRVDVVTGIISTIVGNGTSGFSGDGAAAADASLNAPNGIAIDDAGNVFIADSANHRIRRVDAGTGIITTIAGTGTASFSGDGGAATGADLNSPADVAFDLEGRLLIADELNHRVRRIDMATGVITTVAGTGEMGISPEDTAPLAAKLNRPRAIVAIAGEIAVSDAGNHRVVGVDFDDNTLFTLVGNGAAGNNGTESDSPQSFQLNNPGGLALDVEGSVFITDTGNHRVLWFEPTFDAGFIEVFAGTGSAGFAGDGGDAFNAQLSAPAGVFFSRGGDVYIADTGNHRVRRAEWEYNPGDGVVLENNPGATVTFDLLWVGANGRGLHADDTGTVNIAATHPLTGQPNAVVRTRGNDALDITDTTIDNGSGDGATFRYVSSENSQRDGIVLDVMSGGLTIESGLITGANQEGQPFTAGIAIEEGNADITINATVVNTTGRAIFVSGRTGGEINFGCPIYHDVDGASAVVIEDNTAGSTTFHAPLFADSGSAPEVVEDNNGDHVVTFAETPEPENSPPMADAGEAWTVAEGATILLDGGDSSDPDQTTSSLTFEWDLDYDGSSFQVDATGEEPAVSFPNDFPARTIAVRVTDAGGLSDVATTTLTVTNVLPSFSAGPDVPYPAGGNFNRTINFTDPGAADAHTVTVNWDDGSDPQVINLAAGVSSVDLAHAFPAPDNYTVTVTIGDGSGTASDGFDVTFTNSPPTADANGPYTVAEGGTVSLSAAGSADPNQAAATLTYEWDLDYDGSSFQVDKTGEEPAVSFADDFPARTIALRVTDAGGLSDVATTMLTVTNVLPSFSAGPDVAYPAGGNFNRTINFTDPGAADAHAVTVNWDDGSDPQVINLAAGVSSVDLVHTFPAPANYAVTVTIGDGSGTASDGFDVTFTNSPPTADANGPYTVAEGGTVSLSAAGSADPNQAAATLTYEWDLDYDGSSFQVDATGEEPAVSFPDDFPARTIALRVTDAGGLSDVATTTLTVTNVLPAFDPGEGIEFPDGGTFNRTIAFTDPGTDDTHTVTVNWGDGGDAETINVPQGNRNFTLNHTYASRDSYTILVSIGDGAGNTPNQSIEITASNQPPVADAGGPYTGEEGETITLDGSDSADDADANSALTFEWDLDYNGTDFDVDATGETADVTFATAFAARTLALRVTDTDGLSHIDTTTLAVTEPAPVLQLRLDVTDLDGQPIDRIVKGGDFLLKGFVEDLRDEPLGAFTAFFDVTFDDPETYAVADVMPDAFPNNFSGSAGIPGLIDEVGGMSGVEPLGGGEHLLFSVMMRAGELGEHEFQAEPADWSPSHDVTMHDWPGAVTEERIDFVGASIEVLRPVTAVDDSLAVDERSEGATLEVLANDVIDWSGATITSVGLPDRGGHAAIAADGLRLLYTPDSTFVGVETVRYTVSHADGGSDTAVVAVTVTNTNDDPFARPDSFVVFSGETAVLQPLGNDTSGPDAGEVLTIAAVGPAADGATVEVGADGQTIEFTPAAGVYGLQSFPYTISDGNGGTASSVVTVEVLRRWQNPNNPLDADGSGSITSQDALQLIQEIRSLGSVHLSDQPTAAADSAFYLDVNGDGAFTAQDILLIIAELRRDSSSESEPGEGEPLTEQVALAGGSADVERSSDLAAAYFSGTARAVRYVTPFRDIFGVHESSPGSAPASITPPAAWRRTSGTFDNDSALAIAKPWPESSESERTTDVDEIIDELVIDIANEWFRSSP